MSWDRAGFEYGDEMNRYDGSEDELVRRLTAALIGKVVASVELRNAGTDEVLVLGFDDGSHVTIASWDYEGYSSGLYVFDAAPASAPEDWETGVLVAQRKMNEKRS